MEPKYTFDTGIPQTIDWYLNNKEWWENIILVNIKLFPKHVCR